MPGQVLQVIASTATGGGTTHLEWLMEAMRRHGFSSQVWSGSAPSASTVARHDLVHAHGLGAALKALIPCLITRRPLLYTVHGWSWHPGRTFPAYVASWLLERLVTGLSQQVICVAEADRRLGSRVGLLATTRVQVVPHAIELPTMPRLIAHRGRRLRIGFVGRLTWQKGVDVLLEALGDLPEREDWVLWIIGDGPARPDLERQAARLGIADRTRWLGDRPDAPDYLSQMDLVVMPSRWEGLPYVALEAMARSRPVIGAAVNGLEDLLIESGGGLVVPRDDPYALTLALDRLLGSATLRQTCGHRGREHVVRHHGFEPWERRMVSIYSDCMTP